ncbi:hypothetical protein BDF19DRAFT_428571 [Syncephalis fuscata]|nr:hypothetical protein BDF19DRAFT_428571 [Syncephalis fuscata]
MEKTPYTTGNWKQHPLHPNKPTKQPLIGNWIFIIDLLNFSFWSDYNGQSYTGYWALCAAINRAMGEGIPITQASFYANATDEQLLAIFRSNTSEQIHCQLKEFVYCVKQQFNGSFVNCIKAANQQASNLVDIIVTRFSVFRDECDFNERKGKACFDGKNFGQFNDIDYITMFADYRVPQSLVYLGLLQYSTELQQQLEAGKPLDYGSRQEIEIRGNSIWAVEQLRQCMQATRNVDQSGNDDNSHNNNSTPINAILLDFYLWDFAKDNAEALSFIPVHRTRSIFY